ncbi:MAG: response regulator [Proteobacteria bacterium]|nr:response regulator [Pseudomonadota bacterium]MBU1687182.1 response regulator [Pseudomonadota bacterium]
MGFSRNNETEQADLARQLAEANARLDVVEGERKRLESLLDAINDGVSVQDRQFHVLYQNRAHKELAGDHLGELCYVKYSKLDGVCPGCPVEKSFLDGKPHLIEKIPPPDVDAASIEISASSLFDDDGRIIAGVEVVRDVSIRRQMEDELRKRQKLESISILAGGIAHDFNNILAAILGNISLAMVKVDHDDPVYAKLQKTEQGVERACRLTDQLLAFSRGGAPVKERISLPELLPETADFILSGSNVEFTFQCSDDLWDIEVDKGQFNQVIQNLVLNARQAMSQGGKVSILAENCEIYSDEKKPLVPGRYIRLIISDQGQGIAPAHRDMIFDPYFTTKEAGNGLGLAVVYSIVRRHDGHISFTSALNKGTSFTLFLPAVSGSVSETLQGQVPVQKGQGRILLMDDELEVREIVKEMLEVLGYEVLVASDGAQAIDLYREALASNRTFDVVIMDLTIPGGIGGREAFTAIREIHPEVKAVVSSGYSNDPVMANYQDYGFCEVMPKPYRFETVGKILSKILA